MIKVVRQNKILEYLDINGSLSISIIAKELDCSEETIRKDLIELEKESKLVRTHGGAYIEYKYHHGFSLNIRETLLKNEKIYIANKAIDIIKERDTIMLDSSTTCIELAKKIIDSKIIVTIITNSLQIANLCEMSETVKFILIGGNFRKKNKSFVGYLATEALSAYHADISFVSYPSINMEFGFGDNKLEELKIRNLMLKHSKKKVLLLDHTKFDDNDSIVFSKMEPVDLIVTDKKLSKKWEDFLKKENINVRF